MDKDDKFTVEGEDADNDDTFKHDESIERYLNNPDAVIADFTGHRFVFSIRSEYITDDGIADVEDVIRDTVINYEYTFHRMNVTSDRIEVEIEISVNEAPLESAERFQKNLEQAGIDTELQFVGTLSKK